MVAGALAALLVVFALGTAACGTSGSQATLSSTSVGADVLRLASSMTLTTWDPRAAVGDEPPYLANCYEPLVWTTPDGKGLTPALATSWEVSKDGLVWTFHLRQGVKFHDGADFNAAAVKYSIESTRNLGMGAAVVWDPVPLARIVVVDPYTVRFELRQPMALGRVLSSMYGAFIFSPKTKGKPQSWWDTPHEDGTGPYVLQSYQPGQKITFVRDPNYWGGWKNNQYRQVVAQIVSDAVTQQQMLEAGEVDYADLLSADSIPTLRTNPNVKVVTHQSVLNEVMMFNTSRTPLNNVKVRQALAYAIPYQEIITVGANGLATQARSVVPAGLYPYDTSVPQFTYDLNKGRALLAQAGYPHGGFSLTLTYQSDEATQSKWVPLVKEAYAKLGVTVNLQPLLWEQQWAKAKGPVAQRQDIFVMLWWPTYPDGYDTLRSFFHKQKTLSYDLCYWQMPAFDKLIDTAYSLEGSDPARAQQLYNQAQTLLFQQAPAPAVFDLQAVAGFNPALHLGPLALNPVYSKVLFWYYVTL